MNQVAVQKIRELQEKEGSQPCFKTNKLYCPYMETCCWGEICLHEFFPKVQHAFVIKE